MGERRVTEWLSAFFTSNAVFGIFFLTLLIFYFSSERSVLHFSRNLRRVYFLVLVALLSYWLLSAVQRASSGLEVVMIVVVVMASVVEDKMERSIYLTPFSATALEEVLGTPEAVGKAELVDAIIRDMNRWQGFSIGLAKQLAWLDGSLHKHQAAVHQVLETADSDELNFILAHNNCANLLEVAAEKSVDLLTQGRLQDLTVLSRAILLDGFQKIGLRHRPLRQLYAHRLLMHTRAEDLSMLKSFLDDGADYHTAFKLLYSDFQGELQQEVLQHVSREGQRALARFHKQHPLLPGMTLKVVSDIDDTLMSSEGHFPAGSDLRFPRNCVYPGVLAFYRALDAAFAQRIQDGYIGNLKLPVQPPTDDGVDDLSGLSPLSDSFLRPFSRSGTPARPATRRPSSPSYLDRLSPSRDHAQSHYRPHSQEPPRQVQFTSHSLQDTSESSDGDVLRPQDREGDPSGTLESIAESSAWEEESEAESVPCARGGEGLAGTGAGAALGAVMPSPGSITSMVGLTMLAHREGLPPLFVGPAAKQAPLQRPLAGDRGRGASTSGRQEVAPGPSQASGHLVFLSARPESYKGFTEGLSFKRIFEPLVRRGELKGYPVLLLGSLRVGPTALYAYAADRRGAVGPASMHFYRALAEKKLSRFKQFAAIYPECCWIFVGDNGQGDVLLAEHLLELLGRSMVACFLHQVVPLSETATRLRRGAVKVTHAEAEQWLQTWRQQRIFLAEEYVALAAEAHKQGLIDDLGLQCVALDAYQDMRHVAARFAHSSFDRVSAVKQLNSGIAAANARLPADMRVDPMPVPSAPQQGKHA